MDSDDFVNNIKILRVADIEVQLDRLSSNQEQISGKEINEIVTDIGLLFKENAKR